VDRQYHTPSNSRVFFGYSWYFFLAIYRWNRNLKVAVHSPYSSDDWLGGAIHFNAFKYFNEISALLYVVLQAIITRTTTLVHDQS
jgi:hypothetical protein